MIKTFLKLIFLIQLSQARSLIEIDDDLQEISNNENVYNPYKRSFTNSDRYDLRQFYRPSWSNIRGNYDSNQLSNSYNNMNPQQYNYQWTNMNNNGWNTNQWSGNNNFDDDQSVSSNNNYAIPSSNSNTNNVPTNSPVAPVPVPASAAAASSSSSSSCLDSFRTKALERTNFYRQKHRANPLSTDKSAENVAQNYGQTLNSQFTFQHNPNLRNLKLGENLYRKMQSRQFSLAPADCERYAVEAIDSWYNEVSLYNFNSGTFSGATGHFTQLVWKSTTGVGHGLAISSEKNPRDGFYYLTVVANYSPPGNMMGAFQANVLAA